MAQTDLDFICYDTKASEFAKADEARFRLYLSTLCALYHLAINFSEEKERFRVITKSPEETFTSVLESLDLGISFEHLMKHQINV
ncbi:hypothetical protein A6E02_18320 [Aliivibrio fischeri]|nr:hypothetical protein A6E02_18320 [Aliivibrio fischeri]